MREGIILAQRIIDDEVELTVYPMLFGNVRLCLGEPGEPAYEKAWCYQSQFAQDAIDDALLWDGEGQPPGRWYKDIQTQERRVRYMNVPVPMYD